MSAFVLLFLSGCTSAQVGVPYDQKIDDELNTYHKSAVQFIKSMEQAAGTPEGRFGNEKAQKFYAESAANLANVQVRADVLSGKECFNKPVQNLIKKSDFASIDATLQQKQNTLGGTDSQSKIATSPSGNCLAVMVRGVRLAQQRLESDHQTMDKLTPTVATLNQESISASVTVALKGLRAKKP
ncbi:hypothetical protein ATU3B_23400 [Agrobacterium genomosp. 3 str. CIP 111-78]|uniref:hypothetical protein n=1 Tax=Agrobacterium tomkonis TaxID=1183410 RepID=UPI001CD9BAFD|nr:hypothetical protein [Agrobacterium tomkonis]MCA2374577.1 hypothetical protein [Agrobacterium tomkonis CIP 111-78]